MPANSPGPAPVNRSAVATQQPQRALVTAEATYAAVVDTLKSNQGAEAKALRAMFGGDKSLTDRFLAVAMAALAKNSNILQDATPISIVQAIKDAAALGLEPMTDDAGIAVYGGQAKLMPMWRGYIKRIRNSREVTDIDCQLVYEQDQFELGLGTDPFIRHVPFRIVKGRDEAGRESVLQDRGGYLGAYAWARMPSGQLIVEWMTEGEIQEVRRQFAKPPRSGEKGPWETSWGEMARKTVIRRLAKRLPGSAVDRLLALDGEVDTDTAEQAKVIAEVKDDLADVRRLAFQAVGALPATVPEPEPTVEPTVEAPAPEPAAEPAAAPPADGMDADLAAGMALLPKPKDRRG
jgi:recombination protein RecT